MTTDDSDGPGEQSIDAWLAERRRERAELEPEGDADSQGEETPEVGETEVGQAEVGETEVGQAEVGQAEVGQAEVGETEVGDPELTDIETPSLEERDQTPLEPAPPPAPLRFIEPPADIGVAIDEIAPLATEPPPATTGPLFTYSPVDLVSPAMEPLVPEDKAEPGSGDDEVELEVARDEQAESEAVGGGGGGGGEGEAGIDIGPEVQPVVAGVQPDPVALIPDSFDVELADEPDRGPPLSAQPEPPSEPKLEPVLATVDSVVTPAPRGSARAPDPSEGRRAASVLALIGVSALVGLLVATLIAAALFLASIALRHGLG